MAVRVDDLYGTPAFDEALANLAELTPLPRQEPPEEPNDTLQTYLAELAKVPWPSAQQEADWVDRADLAAKRELVEAHLWLVVDMAEATGSSGEKLLDLIQEGNRGLMQAVDLFRNGRGYRFARFAAYWVAQQLGPLQ